MLCFLLLACVLCFSGTGMASLQHVPPTCTPFDYQITSEGTTCDGTTSTRSVVYRKSLSSQSSCQGPETITLSNQPCECDLYEYRPQLSSYCQNDQRRILGWNASDTNCAQNAEAIKQLQSSVDPATSWIPCECTLDDMASQYTECDHNTKTRLVVHYWKKPCLPTTVVLPRSSKIGCHDECDDGQYLAPPNTQCANCSSGTYSITGDVYGDPWIVTDPELPLPPNFHTQCSGSGCHGWVITPDGLLESGSQHGANTIVSTLIMTADIKTAPSSLEVTFRTSSQIYSDYFVIYVNGRPLRLMAGIMENWTTQVFDLHEAGRECTWMASDPADASSDANMTNICLVRNAFEPFRPEIHFNASVKYSFQAALVPDLGCQDSDFLDKAKFSGKIAVIRRGQCTFVSKILRAQQAGAAAVIIVDSGEPVGPPGLLLQIHMNGDSHNMTIPSVMVSLNDGNSIIHRLTTNPDLTLSIEHENVKLGQVEIKFVYVKDGAGASGDDKVYIKRIQVRGTKYAASECLRCPVGHSSPVHSSQCHACPENHYSNVEGAPWPCFPCPVHTYAPPGSTQCIATADCGEEDYLVQFTPCAKRPDGKLYRTRKYVLATPILCNVTSSTYVPPADVDEACGTCSEGYVRDPTTLVCQPCADGYKANNVDNVCDKCPPNAINIRAMEYDGFEDLATGGGKLPANWTSFCKNCLHGADDGWSFVSQPVGGGGSNDVKTFLAAGNHMGSFGYAVLIIPFTIDIRAKNTSVSIEYHFDYDDTNPLDPQTTQTHFSVQVKDYDPSSGVDRMPYFLQLTPTKSGEPKKLNIGALRPGDYTMAFYYARLKQSVKPVTFVLRGFSINGTNVGGSATCDACPEGYTCASGDAVECGSGTYSTPEGASCAFCTGNTVTFNARQTKCDECALGTSADTVTRSVCYFYNGSFMVPAMDRSRYYDFTLDKILGAAGPFQIGNHSTGKASPQMIWLNLRTQSDGPGGFIPTGGPAPGSAQPSFCEGIDGPYACFDDGSQSTDGTGYYSLGSAASELKLVDPLQPLATSVGDILLTL
eukprot:PhF_6_TR27910/c0_g1_i4/m.40973